MQPTVFRYDRSKTRRFDFIMLAFCLMLGLFSLTDFVSEYRDSGSVSWFDLVSTAIFSVLAILFLTKIAGVGFAARMWDQVHLSLDDQGLTYGRGGIRSPRRWSWAELSAFEFDHRSAIRGGPGILFRTAAPSVMDRLTMDLTISGPKVRLPDFFDAPPREIAATLNEYRDRALGAASAKTRA